MKKRRQFLKFMLGFFAGFGISSGPFGQAIRVGHAKTQKIILPKDTDMDTLSQKDPALLDTRNLEPIPLKNFRTMGDTNYNVNINDWRLEVTGLVNRPLRLSYSQILTQFAMERNVLLICRGFFANHGRWKGIAMAKLLEKAQLQTGVTHVTFSAPRGAGGNVAKFPLADILSEKVFLAYGVNSVILPRKHGFPLRLVAEGYHGSVWVKYVNRVKLVKI